LFSSFFKCVNPIDTIMSKCDVIILSAPTPINQLPPNDDFHYYCRYTYIPANSEFGHSPSPNHNIVRLICRPSTFFPVRFSHLMTHLLLPPTTTDTNTTTLTTNVTTINDHPNDVNDHLAGKTVSNSVVRQPIKRKLTDEFQRMNSSKMTKLLAADSVSLLFTKTDKAYNNKDSISLRNNNQQITSPNYPILSIPKDQLSETASTRLPSTFLDSLHPADSTASTKILHSPLEVQPSTITTTKLNEDIELYKPVFPSSESPRQSPSIFDSTDGFTYRTPRISKVQRRNTDRYLVSAPAAMAPVIYDSQYRSSNIFANIQFMITGFKNSEALRVHELIVCNGGRVIEDPIDILHNASESSTLLVISSRKLTTVKFMFSLARCLPPITAEWLEACHTARKLLPLFPKYIFQDALEDQEFRFKRSIRAREGKLPLPMKERALRGLVVMITGPESLVVQWGIIVREAGGTIYKTESTTTTTTSKTTTPIAALECHILIVLETKGFTPSSRLLEHARSLHVHIVTIQWLIKTLHYQALQNYDQFRYD
jgi:hypothetical protein